MTDSDLMSIRDELRVLKDVVFNLQSLDANLKKKKRGFSAQTRKEIRYMYTFRKNSMEKVEQVLKERASERKNPSTQVRKVQKLWQAFKRFPSHKTSDSYTAAYLNLSGTQRKEFHAIYPGDKKLP